MAHILLRDAIEVRKIHLGIANGVDIITFRVKPCIDLRHIPFLKSSRGVFSFHECKKHHGKVRISQC